MFFLNQSIIGTPDKFPLTNSPHPPRVERQAVVSTQRI
jgi:hypothetical protein